MSNWVCGENRRITIASSAAPGKYIRPYKSEDGAMVPDALGRISLGSTILNPAIASWGGIRRVPGVPLSCVDEYMYASDPLSEWWFDKVKEDARFGEDRDETSIFRPEGTRNSSKA